MSAITYWRECLINKFPLRMSSANTAGVWVKYRKGPRTTTWPYAVARAALYEDYRVWFRQSYLKQFVGIKGYFGVGDQLPQPDSELSFYVAMAPWLYLVSKEEQVRSYVVPVREHLDGRWWTLKKHRNFVRLCRHEQHVAVFEMLTGLVVYDALANMSNEERLGVVNKAKEAFREELKTNKEIMDKRMGVTGDDILS